VKKEKVEYKKGHENMREKILEESRIVAWCSGSHTSNPSYSGGIDQEDHGSKLAQENSSRDYLQKPITKKGWWSGSGCRL
jgi:hypothetical protein